MIYFGYMNRIGPVPKRDRFRAACHLVAGRSVTPWTEARAETYLEMYRQQRGRLSAFWWTLQGEDVLAAAMVLASKGRVGFLYHSPTRRQGVVGEALSDLIRAVSLDRLSAGLSMVQAFVAPEAAGDEPILRASGFVELAELRYMEYPLNVEWSAGDESAGTWDFQPYRKVKKTAMIHVIRRTYIDTLDCQRLCGVRRMVDVLASHRSQGKYTPKWWQMVMRDGYPAGCILMNRAIDSPVADIAYLGVVPEFRGHGLGDAMLAWAARTAKQAKLCGVRLAVDAQNAYARGLYDRFGFVEREQKRIYALFAEPSKTACE